MRSKLSESGRLYIETASQRDVNIYNSECEGCERGATEGRQGGGGNRRNIYNSEDRHRCEMAPVVYTALLIQQRMWSEVTRINLYLTSAHIIYNRQYIYIYVKCAYIYVCVCAYTSLVIHKG